MREGLYARGLQNDLVGPLDLEADRGSCLVISGMSGSGKSLLLRMIADLDPHHGEAWLDGVPRAGMAASRWRRRVGYVPAESGWWSEHVADHFPEPDRVRVQLSGLGLDPGLLDAPVQRLSTGERQRLALLRALAQRPDILLLDEPCSALDEVTTLKVEALLATEMGRGLGLVVVSHDEAQVLRLGRRRLRMEDGALHEVMA